jgi:hypothetical protein
VQGVALLGHALPSAIAASRLGEIKLPPRRRGEGESKGEMGCSEPMQSLLWWWLKPRSSGQAYL